MPELTATYRLQMNAAFTFAHARALVDYFARLGVSHLYLSPILAARKGSMHGYDVVDHSRINPELGTEDDLRALAADLRAHDMGIIVDIVPNHMGIAPENALWQDVLANGEESRYAKWFDIDWNPPGGAPHKVVLPTLDGALDEVVDEKHYRRVHWRRAPHEINYRRFFDVNDLVALRAEDEDVFRESHALILELARDGVIDGVRVDHIDGLRDPLAYLRRLRASLPAGAPIFVEKILSEGEQLRDWPIEGTTGYEFLNDLEDVFIDPGGFEALESAYRRIRRLDESVTFRELARAGKVATLSGPLRADVYRLAAFVPRGTRNIDDIGRAIVQVAAGLPVYRTYIDASGRVEDVDRRLIERALRDARAHAPSDQETISFIGGLLLEPNVEFALRFQQLTGPATAKGVEDTALYVYVPLVSRNEVGGAPDRPLHDAVSRFHEGNRRRAERWPLGLNATNTHDTKRSADVRARIDALAGLPDEWARSVRRWRKLNARHRKTIKGRLAPDTNTEYLIYQILVALWPAPRPGRRADDIPDRAWRDAVRERLERYALKSAREAKTRTSWTDPDSAYENALREFIAAILQPAHDAPFLVDLARFVSLIAPLGAATSLARVALHLMSPGTPDIYQGDELWNFTLVDPDNRRPVDFDERETLLGCHPERGEGPASKLSITHRLLALRRERPALFRRGTYAPIYANGPAANNIVAFARTLGDQRVLVVTTRLDPHPDVGGTALDLPETLSRLPWRSRLSSDSTLQLATLLSTIPVAVLSD